MKRTKTSRPKANIVDRSPISATERKILERLRTIRREQEKTQEK